MKDVLVQCSYIISCFTVVEVPDEFEFVSDEPEERIDELEKKVERIVE